VTLTDEAPRPPRIGRAFDKAGTALFAGQIQALASQMGEHLCRLARSVSIRERRDFSCAVFDAAGNLLANAPHVPVHLGAMGETVRDLLRRHGPALLPGRAWASNDPTAGGSHLPDITVTQPVFVEDQLLGFVACRGHHADVGGLTPGSMPPFSRCLADEGLVLRQVALNPGGIFVPPPLPGCRQVDVVIADLEAQVAACALGARRLGALAEQLGAEVVRAQGSHLLDAAEGAARAVLAGLPGRHVGEERLDDGSLIRVILDVAGGEARCRLEGPAHPGNANAPRGVARAALLYVFRCLSAEALPLNEGALRPFTLEIPPGSLFDPGPEAAVVAGNVETSQRLVDALLQAIGALAASQGTMNNLTVGTARGAFYETIGGGMGAGPLGPGASAVQVHMTNTRATDLEELEHRFPVRIERWGRRWGSGGEGQHRGGDGTDKQLVFLEPCTVALLAGRRDEGAAGIAGGASGAPGLDLRQQGEAWEPAPPQWRAAAGDRLRIQTPGGGGWGSSARQHPSPDTETR
jgi:5-oxoprolinase (ATP-hydrolysing)